MPVFHKRIYAPTCEDLHCKALGEPANCTIREAKLPADPALLLPKASAAEATKESEAGCSGRGRHSLELMSCERIQASHN